MGYIRKACHFAEKPLLWGTKAATNVVDALKLQGSGRYRPPNFARIELTVKIIARESRDSDFSHLSFISFLYALRVPSETPHLRGAFRNDDITGFSPMVGKAPI